MDARVKPGYDEGKKSAAPDWHAFHSAALSSDFT